MSPELLVLTSAALSIAFLHTVLGPDHYLPFVVLSQARNWSVRKTVLITSLCGVGHIAGSIVLGLLGVGLGLALGKLEAIESARGELAAWGLIGFGLVYCAWGIRKAYRNQPHTHRHFHSGGSMHAHPHTHEQDHLHPHLEENEVNLTPWVLFTIFALGPCEPLIPLLMYPAAAHNSAGVIWVASVFGIVTIATMLGVVLTLVFGLGRIPSKTLSLKPIERFSHALAGLAILFSGLAIKFLGL